MSSKIRKDLCAIVTTCLDQYGFMHVKPNALEWVRHNGSIGHVVGIGKLKGPVYRVGCYVLVNTPASKKIGGDLSHSCIGVGESLAHHSWRIVSDNETAEAGKEICNGLEEIAMPWFSLFRTITAFEELTKSIGKSNTFGSDSQAYFELPTSEYSLERKSSYTCSERQFREWAGNLLVEGFVTRSYVDVHGDGRVFRRKRGDVSDVIYVYLINLGLHFGVRAVNWIPEVSAQGSREFSSSLVPFLNGGPISDGDLASGQAFLLNSRDTAKQSVEKFFEIFDRKVEPKLKAVTNKEEFVSTISPKLLGLARTMLRQNDSLDLLSNRSMRELWQENN